MYFPFVIMHFGTLLEVIKCIINKENTIFHTFMVNWSIHESTLKHSETLLESTS